MVQPSVSGAAVVSDPGARRLTIDEAAPLLGIKPRTAYDYRKQGKLRCERERQSGAGTRWRYWTTVAWVEECRLTRDRWKHPGRAAPAAAALPPAQAPHAVPPVHTGPTSDPVSLEARARSILGDDASPERLAHLGEAIREHHRNLQCLHRQMRLLLLEDYFARVRDYAHRVGQLGSGIVAATLAGLTVVLTGAPVG